ncbi:MAG: hypothetical protein RJA98_3510 [Pseudomonadota bacterium]|jgi:PAS domain S-box-containing protein
MSRHPAEVAAPARLAPVLSNACSSSQPPGDAVPDASAAATPPGTAERPHPAAADLPELFQTLVEGLPHLLWATDADGRCDFLSPQWATFSGRPISELLGQGWAEHLHPQDRERVAPHWQESIQTGRPYNQLHRLRRHDGVYCTYQVQGVPHRGPDGRPQRWLGICNDVQQQLETTAALAAERQRIEAIANVAPAILHSFRIDLDGRMSFPFGHERIAALYGTAPNQLSQPNAPLAQFLHEADRDWLPAAMAESARTMTPFRGEFRVQHPSRGVLWVETHSMPVREPDGSTVWQGTMTDVTERKAVAQALADSRAQFESVFANLDEGIAVFNPRGELMHFNPAAYLMHGVPPANDLGVLADFADAFEVHDLAGQAVPMEDWSMARILRGEVLRNHEVQVRNTRLGWTRTFSYSGAMVHGDDGQPQFGVLRMNDVSERKRTEAEVLRLNAELEQRVSERTAELQAAVKELEAFTYSVSHDLRAPLRAIDGFSQAVLQDHSDVVPETGRRYLGIIRESAQKMGQLIDDLLAFSRIGRQQPTMRRVQHGMLVRSALQQLEPLRQGRTVKLQVAELPDSQGDPAMLHQVWINLLSNALKYSRKVAQAEVEVGALPHTAGGPTYFVRDNGTGFDMRFAHKLFAVFERLHRSDEFEGTGVGLAIVQRIVQRHGGQVRAEGALGQGATIYFQLQSPESLS